MKQPWQWGLLVFALALSGCQREGALPSALPDAGSRALSPPPVASESVSVAIRNFVYEPASVSIKVGQAVSWTNYDPAPHDAVAFPGSGTWKTPLLKINESATQVFREPGVYPYYCSVHPAMRGTVEVRE